MDDKKNGNLKINNLLLTKKIWKIIGVGNYMFFFFITGPCLLAQAQLIPGDWAQPLIHCQQRVDLRNLGFPNVNEIPEYNTAITSLVTSRDGMIYGGTTGKEAYLFLFNSTTNKVRHLGKIPHEESIHHALTEDSLGHIYIGTGKNMFNKIDLSKEGYWEQIDKSLWDDITEYFQNYAGGHLYRYEPENSNGKVKLPDMQAEVQDLGIPVPGNSIYALTSSPDGSIIYGITYPEGQFFLYDIVNQNIEVIGPIDEKIVFHGPERYWRSLSRDLICDTNGNVYFSGSDGVLKYYSPEAGKFKSTGQMIPGDYYPAQFYEDYAVAEYFDLAPSGKIYGGTSDGYLFMFDPNQMKLHNLGKPRANRRLRCLTVGLDGKVYLIAGERPVTSSVPCKLYVYDPGNPEFIDYGIIIVDRSPYYYRRGFQFDSMTTGKDGTIYLGESEFRSNLFLLLPPLMKKP